MKTAVVYYSMSGNTEYAAREIASRLDADLIPIKPVRAYPDKGFRKYLWGGKSVLMKEKPRLEPYRFDAAAYGRVVFGTPVWAGSVAPPLRTFIAENRDALRGKRFAAFVCLKGSGAEKAIETLKELLEVYALETQTSLIDPKDQPTEENARKLERFCGEMGEA